MRNSQKISRLAVLIAAVLLVLAGCSAEKMAKDMYASEPVATTKYYGDTSNVANCVAREFLKTGENVTIVNLKDDVELSVTTHSNNIVFPRWVARFSGGIVEIRDNPNDVVTVHVDNAVNFTKMCDQ